VGENLINQMLPALEKMAWPENLKETQLGYQTYQVGLEKVDAYKGDPKTFGDAIRTFQAGDSRPYAFAGVAYTLLAAARETDGSYARPGLDAAMSWLEKAQELEPDRPAINVIEAFIYIYGGRYDDARLVLDYLSAQDPNDNYLLLAEIQYWQQQKDVTQAVQWYEKAIQAASTVPQRLRLRSRLGDCYLEFGLLDQALTVYQEALHFDKENPWLWHNLSVVYWRQEKYEEAARCNKRALDLLELPQARRMEEAIKEKLDSGGMFGRLFKR
jgi:tetratricopeptide (TPR) repeat protein